MELPFAVDAAPTDDASSLVTASSQGSLVPADDLNLSQQHEEGGVFSVQTEPLTPPRREGPLQAEQQHLEPASNFRPTIAELPPPAPPTIATQAAAPLPSSISTGASLGVDALKSAGSRVSSVLSHFGYIRSTSGQQHNNSISLNSNRHSTTNSALSASGQRAPTTTTTTTTTAAAIQEHPDTEAIDYAYINVTDEDEVDIWLDDNNTQYYNNNNNNYGEGDAAAAAAASDTRGRADILTLLLQQGDATSSSDTNNTNGAEQLVAWTEQANDAAARAVTAKKEGNLQDALDRHSDAAKLFHEAAVLVRERDGTYRTAVGWID